MPCVLLGLGLAACKDGGERDRDSPLADEELPPECAPGQEEALRRKIEKSVSRIRIAQSNADLKMMDEHERTLAVLADCKPAFDRICDAECAGQRASVHLFRAAAIPLLASRSIGLSTSEAELLREAASGIQIIEAALAKLPRQKGFGAGDGEADVEGVGGFNRYLQEFARLQAIHAELQMTAGDILYRRMSTDKSKTVSFVVDQVLATKPRPRGEGGSDLERALVYYEQAYWTLLEARTSLPADLDGSPLFGAELNKLYDLTQQVGERLRSAREGKLYIGIDPSGLQDGARPNASTLDQLLGQLERQRGELAKVEGEIGNKMQAWKESAEGLAAIGDQMAELKSGRAIDLAVHKVTQVRDLAEKRAAPIQTAIEHANIAGNQFELEGRILAARLQLQVSKRGLGNDLVALEAKNEEDILDRKIEGLRLDLDVVRNAIDTTLADYNFEMQLAGLRQQQEEYKHQRDHEQGNLTAHTAKLKQVQADIDSQLARQKGFQIEIDILRLRKNEVIANQIASLKRQIEAMDHDLQFFEAREGFIDEICAERAKLGALTQEVLDKQAACLRGSSCGPGSLTTLYQQLLANKKRRNQAVVTQAKASKKLLEQNISRGEAALRDLEAKASNRQGSIESDKNWALNQALLPSVEAGLPPSIGGSVDPFKRVGPKLDAAAQQYQLAVEKLQFGYQVGDNISAARAQLEEATQQLTTAEIDDAIVEIEKQQALSELHVRLLDVEQQRVLNEGQRRTSAIECKEMNGKNVGDLGRTRAERAALEAQIAVQAGERDILDEQLKKQDTEIEESEALIRKHEGQREELAEQKKQSERAIQHFTKMAEALEAQMQSVTVYQGKVAKLTERRDQLQTQLTQYVDQISLVRLQANAEQKKFLMAAIEDAEQVASETIAVLQEQVRNNQKLAQLTSDLAAVQAEGRDDLMRHTAELTELLNNRPVPTAERVIWDFEDLSSRMLRGAGELLDYKRSLLASTNYYYNAYRYRYNLLSEFVGRAPIADSAPYIWTADDATKRIAQCSELGTSPVCSSSSLANDGTGLNLTSSTFVVQANSPMFQELLRNRRTRFEFAPYAVNPTESHALGDFVMWDNENMDFRDMRVIGFYLLFPKLEGCTPTLTKIRHTGLGYQGRSMVMRAPLAARPTIIAASNSPQEAALELEGRIASWTQNTLSIMQLERRVASDAEGTMPFLGYPLRGVYELTSDSPMDCLKKISEMHLTVVFAVPD